MGLADALLADPPALLLDEPFSGLDPLQRQQFRELLRGLADEGKAVLFSSHVLPEVEELADRVLVLLRGRTAAAGTLDELQATLASRSTLLVRLERPVPGFAEALAAAAEELGVQPPTTTDARDASAEEAGAGEAELRVGLLRPEGRSALFRWLAAQELPVVELREERPDLESLFRTLVEEGPAA